VTDAFVARRLRDLYCRHVASVESRRPAAVGVGVGFRAHV
jgi:hypothetical protein